MASNLDWWYETRDICPDVIAVQRNVAEKRRRLISWSGSEPLINHQRPKWKAGSRYFDNAGHKHDTDNTNLQLQPISMTTQKHKLNSHLATGRLTYWKELPTIHSPHSRHYCCTYVIPTTLAPSNASHKYLQNVNSTLFHCKSPWHVCQCVIQSWLRFVLPRRRVVPETWSPIRKFGPLNVTN